jgi:hypothetical protein
MNVEQLLQLIPDEHLVFLSAETKVDHQVKKLSGSAIFKVILFSMLSSQKVSLRVMETFLQSAKFRQFAQNDAINTKHNSIRDRICTINVEFFKLLFESIFELYNKQLKEEKAITKADSTYVSVAAKLVTWGMQNGTSHYGPKHLKYSVALKGSLPCSIRVFNEGKFLSENLALSELIENCIPLKESVVVFDRGLESRKSFERFTEKEIRFVGRCNPQYYCKTKQSNLLPVKPENSTLTINKDETGLLRAHDNKLTKRVYRMVSATVDKTGEPICFVTNLLEEDAYTIAALYKQRWEIEVFFKFIKQHLNVKHLVSRQKNGIEVMLYMTMITAILILVFKKLNKTDSYKIAKLKFEIQLDNLLTKEIVLLCGGDPGKAPHLWNTS